MKSEIANSYVVAFHYTWSLPYCMYYEVCIQLLVSVVLVLPPGGQYMNISKPQCYLWLLEACVEL